MHSAGASPEEAAGHGSSEPLQNGEHTSAPGSTTGAVPPPHVPPSGIGYSGSSAAPVLSPAPLVVVSAAPEDEPGASPLLLPSEVIGVDVDPSLVRVVAGPSSPLVSSPQPGSENTRASAPTKRAGLGARNEGRTMPNDSATGVPVALGRGSLQLRRRDALDLRNSHPQPALDPLLERGLRAGTADAIAGELQVHRVALHVEQLDVAAVGLH